MKLLSGILLFSILLFLSQSCDEKKEVKNKTVTATPCLLHPFFFQDEIVQLLNFPFWFNDSIIRSNKIQTISWISYGSLLDSDTENDRIEELPKRTVVYTFNRNGQLTTIQQTDFSEGIIISSQTMHLKPGKNSKYYYVSKGNSMFGVENNAYLVIKASLKKNVWQYDNEETDERLHFIPNTKYHKPLSVNSVAHPAENDWVILGTPERPIKRYKVKNMVREKQVTTYSYWNNNYPKETVNDEFPFTKKRWFSYDKQGVFVGYIDSTFIDDSFVTGVSTRISYQNGLPTAVEHLKIHSENEKVFRKKERFEYTLFSVPE